MWRGKNLLATIGNVKSDLLKKFDIKQQVVYADMLSENVFAALGQSGIRFKEISKFPVVRRDLALVLDEKIKFEDLNLQTAKVKDLIKLEFLFD